MKESTTPRQQPGKIARHHLGELGRSGITRQAAAVAGIYTETRPDKIARLLNWDNPDAVGLGQCLVFRYRDHRGKLNGYVRLKPDRPRVDGDGKAIKYEAPKGEPPRAYFPSAIVKILSDPTKPIVITEGEKKALKSDKCGFATIGLAGVWAWQQKRQRDENGDAAGGRKLIHDLEQVVWNGRKVYVVFDSDIVDNPLIQQAEWELARTLMSKGATVAVVRLPAGDTGPDGRKTKVGLDDFLVQNPAKALQRLIDNATAPEAPVRQLDAAQKRPNVAQQLVELVERMPGVEFFATPDGTPYATVRFADKGLTESFPLRSQGFAHCLRRLAYAAGIVGVTDATLKSVVGDLEARAIYGTRPRQSVFTRVGTDTEGSIWLDLADDTGDAARITKNGWTIEPTAGVKFVRRRGQLPLPRPVPGGSVDLLRPFCNVSDADWPLLVGYLAAAMRPAGPYPVLVLCGEQGSAKSTLARVVRMLIDPHSAPLRASPRDGRDLMIAAANNWMLVFDNLSHVEPWLSDALCRLATGGAFCTRQLYSDDEEISLDARRPCLLNGIEEVATRSDLLDRSLILELPTIPPNRRRTEAGFWHEFEMARPKILGALLNAVSMGLRRVSEVHLPTPPRLADFATFVVAAEKPLGLKPGEFLKAYQRNRTEANDLALESSPVAPIIVKLSADGWTGTATQLLKECDERCGFRRPHNFPKNARALSGILKRLAPNLRAVGVEVVSHRKSGGNRDRSISIRQIPGSCVPPRPTTTKPKKKRMARRDGTGRNSRKSK